MREWVRMLGSYCNFKRSLCDQKFSGSGESNG